MDGFTDKTAVITGAAAGIGLATARMLFDLGAHVMLIDIDESMAEAAAEAIDPSGDAAKAYRCDISDEDSVRRVFCDIREKSISVDILVNNAAIWRTGNAEFIYSDSYNWKRKIGVNILGTMYCTHAALRGMTDRGWGRIINVSSVAGIYGIPYMSDYSMTKGAIDSFTKAVAKEVAAFGVTVNAVAPGNVNSDGSKEHEREDLSFIPHSCRPEDVSELICFLASNQAGYITGQVIQIDGCRKKV